jgi:hypothetical protein
MRSRKPFEELRMWASDEALPLSVGGCMLFQITKSRLKHVLSHL